MPNSLQMRIFKPDLSSLGGVFKAPKLGPRHDKMAAHVSESPTTVLLPKGYDDIVNCVFSALCIIDVEETENQKPKLSFAKCVAFSTAVTQYFWFIVVFMRYSIPPVSGHIYRLLVPRLTKNNNALPQFYYFVVL